MNARMKIENELETIMEPGDARACHVYKGYNTFTDENGWHYTPFGENTRYLGKSLAEALGEISLIKESRGL